MALDLERPPATLTTAELAELTRTTVDHWWKLAREGTAPVRPLRLGRQLRWPTRPVLGLLGLDPDMANDAEPIAKKADGYRDPAA